MLLGNYSWKAYCEFDKKEQPATKFMGNVIGISITLLLQKLTLLWH